MRHRKHRGRLSRTSSHRLALMRNMSKSLIEHGRIRTTIPKAKALRSFAEQLVTLAKQDTVQSRRLVKARLGGLHYNKLTSKEAREAKSGNTKSYNSDRIIMDKLYKEIAPRFKDRMGGYTRIIRMSEKKVGDNSQYCLIEYLD